MHGIHEADSGGEAKRQEGASGGEAKAHDREAPEEHAQGLQAEARKGAPRGGKAGHALEDRNRQQLYEVAQRMGIPGRSKMGKWDLIDAIRKAR